MSAEHSVLSLNSPEFKIGRSKEVDLCLMDVNISRLQCIISWCQDSQQWSVTDHSSNGVWAGGLRTSKGVPTLLNQGDIIVLSDLKQLYSWRFGMGKVDPEEIDDQEEPMMKKMRVPVVEEVSGDGKRNNEVMSQHKVTGEVRMLKGKHILENAVKVGQQKQEALMGERDILLAKLEDICKKQSKKESEAREKMEKEMEGKEEREEKMKQLEEVMKIERELQDRELKRLIEEMDLKVKCEEQKRVKEIEARDHLVAKLSAEKHVLENQLEKERDAMENELKVLQKQLEKENSSMKKKENEWNKRLSSISSKMEEKVSKERENMEVAVLKEKQEKERMAQEVEEQIQKRETEVKHQEDLLSNERSKHFFQLKLMEEEREQREIEMNRRIEELKKRKEEQRQLEEEMSKTIKEMERKREEMAKEIESKSTDLCYGCFLCFFYTFSCETF
jgi:pSer/pThr/pTyr-binding forkhead associated (FHA) protein